MSVQLTTQLRLGDLVERLGGELDPNLKSKTISMISAPGEPSGEGILVPIFQPRALSELTLSQREESLFLTLPSLTERLPSDRCWQHPSPMEVMATLLHEFTIVEEIPDERALAQIDPGASIAATARIGAGCILRANTQVGDSVVLEPRVILFGGVTLEPGVRVGVGSVLGRPGFGWIPGVNGTSRMPHRGGVWVEEGAEIGAFCTIDAGVLRSTRIGRGARLDSHVHVGHNVQIGAGVHIAAQSGFAGSAIIQEGVLIGGQVGVADHAVVGAGARLAAKAGVIGDIPAGMTVAGYPAIERIRWLRALARLFRHSRTS